MRTAPGLARPDAQVQIWTLTAKKDAAQLEPEDYPAVSAGGWQMRPLSRGSIAITSPDPRVLPRIRPNFLGHPEDRATLVRLFRYLRAMFARPELAPYLAAEVLPGLDVQDDAAILAASLSGENGYHATGTCRMGADPGSVVDPALRVRGVDGLRIADCSVMPTQLSGGAYAPALALGWHAAELIR